MFATLVALGLVMSAEPPKDKEKELPEAAKKEVAKLQGKWKGVKVAAKGREFEFGADDPEFIGEFKDRKWTLNGVDKAEIVALDPTTDPKCFDLKSLEKARNGAVDEAIYKLDGDTLTICLYGGEGKKRPTGFGVPEGEGTVLMVLKRVPEKK